MSVVRGRSLNRKPEATDFKVRDTKQVPRAKKNFVPPLFQMWGYKQANISRGLLNIIEICCLIVALINIGRPTERHGQPVYCCVSMLACRFEQCSSPVGWTVETRSKPSFQISLTWQMSTRVRELKLEIQSLILY